MTSRALFALASLLLVPAAVLAAEPIAPAPAVAREGRLLATLDGVGTFPIESDPARQQIAFGCVECSDDVRPAAALLFPTEGGAEEILSVRATDWSRGRFVLDGVRELQGEPTPSGWLVSVPLDGRSRPARVLGALEGHVADRAAWWPATEPHVVPAFDFALLEDVLEVQPEWDPARTSECELLVAKDVETPVTFVTEGQPRAWLFPSVSGDGSWTFQFVKPGGSILERVGVRVEPMDEGDSWSFRLPVESVVTEQIDAERRHARFQDPTATGQGADTVPALAVTRLEATGLGIVDLEDCPRSVK